MVIAPVRGAGDPGSNPGPGENFSLKLDCYSENQNCIYIYIYIYIYIFPSLPSDFSRVENRIFIFFKSIMFEKEELIIELIIFISLHI